MTNLTNFLKTKYNQILLSSNNFLVYTFTTLIVILTFLLETSLVWSIGYLLVHLAAGLVYVSLWQAFPLALFAKILFYNCKSKHDKKVNI